MFLFVLMAGEYLYIPADADVDVLGTEVFWKEELEGSASEVRLLR